MLNIWESKLKKEKNPFPGWAYILVGETNRQKRQNMVTPIGAAQGSHISELGFKIQGFSILEFGKVGMEDEDEHCRCRE